MIRKKVPSSEQYKGAYVFLDFIHSKLEEERFGVEAERREDFEGLVRVVDFLKQSVEKHLEQADIDQQFLGVVAERRKGSPEAVLTKNDLDAFINDGN